MACQFVPITMLQTTKRNNMCGFISKCVVAWGIFDGVVTYLLTVNGPFVNLQLYDVSQQTTVVWSFVWRISANSRETSSFYRLLQNIFRMDMDFKTRLRRRTRNGLLLTAQTTVVSTVDTVARGTVLVGEQTVDDGNAGNNGKRHGTRVFNRVMSSWVLYYLGPNSL